MKKTIILTILAVLIQAASYSQCAMCKEVAEASGAASGLNSGIIYMMFAPYILLGGFVFFVFRKKIFTFWKELTGKGENKEYNIDNWY